MEKHVFDWQHWDEVTENIMMFHGCVLKVPVGEFHPGTVFGLIQVDFGGGELTLFGQDGGPISKHKLKLVVE